MNGDTTLGTGGSAPGDALIALLVLNEMRHRIVASIFGVAREDSNRMTVIAVGSLAEGLHDGAARVLAAGAIPPVAAAAIGAGALRETAHAIAGGSSRTTPFFATLVTFALLGKSSGPLLRGTARGVRETFHAGTAGSRRLRALLRGQP